jgi:hypothetical protein
VRIRAIPFAVLAWLFLGGVIVQVLLAGMGLFELTDWTTHAGFGWGLSLVPVVLAVLAVAARVDADTGLLTTFLVISALFQPELAAARHTSPVLAALHPVNAIIVFGLAWLVARRSLLGLRRVDATAPEAAAPLADAAPSPDAAA